MSGRKSVLSHKQCRTIWMTKILKVHFSSFIFIYIFIFLFFYFFRCNKKNLQRRKLNQVDRQQGTELQNFFSSSVTHQLSKIECFFKQTVPFLAYYNVLCGGSLLKWLYFSSLMSSKSHFRLKVLVIDKHSSLLHRRVNSKEKMSLITMTAGACTIKHNGFVIYGKLKDFVVSQCLSA